MALRKKSGNIIGGSLLNVDGQGIYNVKKFQLVLNKSKKSFVIEPTQTPTISPTDVPSSIITTPTPTPVPTDTPTPTPTPTPISPTIVAFGNVTTPVQNIGGYSLDYSGNTWTTGNTQTPNGYAPYLYKGLLYTNVYSVATDGNMWVVGGEYFPQPGFEQYEFSLGYSYDGISWTGITDSKSSGDTMMTCVGYGYDDMSNPIWVAGGSGGSSLHYSFDGINWTWRSAYALTVRPTGVYFGKESGSVPLWIVVGDANPENFAYSQDGQNWNTGSIGRSTENLNCVAYSDTTNIWMVGCDDAGHGTIYTSNDGMNFTESATPPTFSVCLGVAFSNTLGGPNGRWVAVGDDSAHFSDDSGTSWVKSQNGDTYLGKGRSVCWNGQYFIAVGEPTPGQETISYSPDGDTWYGSTSDGNIFSVGNTVASIPGPDMYPPR